MRQCSKCGHLKPLEEFRVCTPAGARRNECKGCEAKKKREYRVGLNFDIDVVEPPPAPVAGTLDLEKLTDDEKTAHIADLIPQAAKASGVAPSDCTWADFRAYCKIAWGESTEGIARRHITRVGGFNAIRDAHFPPTATEYALERRELHELATQNRHAARGETRDALFLRQLEAVLGRVPPRAVAAEGWARKFSDGYIGSRIVTAIWNDDHFDPGCTLPGYDEVGQCRRAAKIASQHVEFKRQYRERAEARIVVNGDMIENWLHGPRGAHPSVQAVSAAEKYAAVVGYVAANYPKVSVVFVPGNHDRDIGTDPGRAIDDKARGFATVIAGMVRAACRNLKNTTVELAAPEAHLDYFGIRAMATHGDTLFGQVSPKKLNTSAIEHVVTRFNAAQGAAGPARLVLLGHWHVDAHTTLDSGVRIQINPALTPSNEHARSIGAFESACGHYVFESAPGHVWGDNRLVRVDGETSKDAGLDGLIAPFVEMK